MLRPLRDRDFRLLWAGMTVSLLGDGVYIVAVAWQAYDVSNSPAALFKFRRVNFEETGMTVSSPPPPSRT